VLKKKTKPIWPICHSERYHCQSIRTHHYFSYSARHRSWFTHQPIQITFPFCPVSVLGTKCLCVLLFRPLSAHTQRSLKTQLHVHTAVPEHSYTYTQRSLNTITSTHSGPWKHSYTYTQRSLTHTVTSTHSGPWTHSYSTHSGPWTHS